MTHFTPARLRELADSLRPHLTHAVVFAQCAEALRFAAEQGEELGRVTIENELLHGTIDTTMREADQKLRELADATGVSWKHKSHEEVIRLVSTERAAHEETKRSRDSWRNDVLNRCGSRGALDAERLAHEETKRRLVHAESKLERLAKLMSPQEREKFVMLGPRAFQAVYAVVIEPPPPEPTPPPAKETR